MPITQRFASESFVENQVTTGLDNILQYVGLNYCEPINGDIPRVFFSGEMPTTKDDVLAEMTYSSKTLTFHSYIKIKFLFDQYYTGHFLLPKNKKEECK